MWWRLSTAPGSDPATKPKARAVIHKARWVSEAEFRFRGSATGLRGVNCVLQPPNIFPEWPDEASDRGGTSVSFTAHTSHLAKSHYAQRLLLQIHREKKSTKKGKKANRDTTQNVGCGGKSPFLFSTELGNP